MSVGSIKYEREPPTKGSSQSPAIRGIFYILISGHSESVILFAEHHYARACGNGKNAKTCNAYSTGYRGLGYGSRCGLCCGFCGFCGLCGINRLIRGLYGLLGDFNRLIAMKSELTSNGIECSWYRLRTAVGIFTGLGLLSRISGLVFRLNRSVTKTDIL